MVLVLCLVLVQQSKGPWGRSTYFCLLLHELLHSVLETIHQMYFQVHMVYFPEQIFHVILEVCFFITSTCYSKFKAIRWVES